jgi:hypothetical protein
MAVQIWSIVGFGLLLVVAVLVWTGILGSLTAKQISLGIHRMRRLRQIIIPGLHGDEKYTVRNIVFTNGPDVQLELLKRGKPVFPLAAIVMETDPESGEMDIPESVFRPKSRLREFLRDPNVPYVLNIKYTEDGAQPANVATLSELSRKGQLSIGQVVAVKHAQEAGRNTELSQNLSRDRIEDLQADRIHKIGIGQKRGGGER